LGDSKLKKTDAGSLNSNVIIRLARSSKFDLCRELAVDAFRVTTISVTKLENKK
jgi:hypothetical protein